MTVTSLEFLRRGPPTKGLRAFLSDGNIATFRFRNMCHFDYVEECAKIQVAEYLAHATEDAGKLSGPLVKKAYDRVEDRYRKRKHPPTRQAGKIEDVQILLRYWRSQFSGRSAKLRGHVYVDQPKGFDGRSLLGQIFHREKESNTYFLVSPECPIRFGPLLDGIPAQPVVNDSANVTRHTPSNALGLELQPQTSPPNESSNAQLRHLSIAELETLLDTFTEGHPDADLESVITALNQRSNTFLKAIDPELLARVGDRLALLSVAPNRADRFSNAFDLLLLAARCFGIVNDCNWELSCLGECAIIGANVDHCSSYLRAVMDRIVRLLHRNDLEKETVSVALGKILVPVFNDGNQDTSVLIELAQRFAPTSHCLALVSPREAVQRRDEELAGMSDLDRGRSGLSLIESANDQMVGRIIWSLINLLDYHATGSGDDGFLKEAFDLLDDKRNQRLFEIAGGWTCAWWKLGWARLGLRLRCVPLWEDRLELAVQRVIRFDCWPTLWMMNAHPTLYRLWPLDDREAKVFGKFGELMRFVRSTNSAPHRFAFSDVVREDDISSIVRICSESVR